MRQSWETMTSVSAGHNILTPTQPVGSGRPQRGSNPGPPHQESRALPTELPRPPIKSNRSVSLRYRGFEPSVIQLKFANISNHEASYLNRDKPRNVALCCLYPHVLIAISQTKECSSLLFVSTSFDCYITNQRM